MMIVLSYQRPCASYKSLHNGRHAKDDVGDINGKYITCIVQAETHEHARSDGAPEENWRLRSRQYDSHVRKMCTAKVYRSSPRFEFCKSEANGRKAHSINKIGGASSSSHF
jgi:hypothetical protein